MSWTQEEIQETVQKVADKAGSDAAFRQLALSDINTAVKEISGKEIPAGFKVNVIDGTGYHANIVLPEAKSSADELSETELESVAGGSKVNFPDNPPPFYTPIDVGINPVDRIDLSKLKLE